MNDKSRQLFFAVRFDSKGEPQLNTDEHSAASPQPNEKPSAINHQPETTFRRTDLCRVRRFPGQCELMRIAKISRGTQTGMVCSGSKGFHSVSALVVFDGMREGSELPVKCLPNLMKWGLASRAHSRGGFDPVVAD